MNVFYFFNCDANKSAKSMNFFYNENNIAYRDSSSSRKRLWSKIQAELDAGRIKIAAENLSRVNQLVERGNPVEANDLILYGVIYEGEYF